MSVCVPCMQQNNISDLLSYANELDIKNPKLASKIDQIVLGMVREAQPGQDPFFRSPKEILTPKTNTLVTPTNTSVTPTNTSVTPTNTNTLQNLGIFTDVARLVSEPLLQRTNLLYGEEIFLKLVYNNAKKAGEMLALAKKQNNTDLLRDYEKVLKNLEKSKNTKQQAQLVRKNANEIIFKMANTIDPQILIYIKSLKNSGTSEAIIEQIKFLTKGKTYEEALDVIAKIQKINKTFLKSNIETAVKAVKPNLSAKAANLIEKIAEKLSICLNKIPLIGRAFSVPVVKTMLSEIFSFEDALTSFISLYNQFQSKTGSVESKVCYFLNFLFNTLQIVCKIPAVVAVTSGSSIGYSYGFLAIGAAVDWFCMLSDHYAFNEAKRLQPTITQSDLSPKDLLASNQLIQLKDRKTINNNFKNMVMNNQFEDPNKVGAYLRNQLLKPITQSAPVAPKTPTPTPTTQSDKSVPITSGQPSTAVVA